MVSGQQFSVSTRLANLIRTGGDAVTVEEYVVTSENGLEMKTKEKIEILPTVHSLAENEPSQRSNQMKSLICVLFTTVFSSILVWSAPFLPEANDDQLNLKQGESIAGVLPNPAKIDGNLDDWKHVVWVTFDSKKDMLPGQADWKGKDDISLTWSAAWDKNNFYFAAAVRDDKFTPG